MCVFACVCVRDRETDYLCQWPFAHNWRHIRESQRQRASWVNEHSLPSVLNTAVRGKERNCTPDDLSPPMYDSGSLILCTHTHTHKCTHTNTHIGSSNREKASDANSTRQQLFCCECVCVEASCPTRRTGVLTERPSSLRRAKDQRLPAGNRTRRPRSRWVGRLTGTLNWPSTPPGSECRLPRWDLTSPCLLHQLYKTLGLCTHYILTTGQQ